MKRVTVAAIAWTFAVAGAALAQQTQQVPYTARAFNPAHDADLPRSAGIPARLANEAYVEALAHVVYYWAYPAIDVTSRTQHVGTDEGGAGPDVRHCARFARQ
jgi:hypothetical protein